MSTISTTSTKPAPQTPPASAGDNLSTRVQQNPSSTPELARNAEHFRQLVKGDLNKGQTNMPQFQAAETDKPLHHTRHLTQNPEHLLSVSQQTPAEQTRTLLNAEPAKTSLSDLLAREKMPDDISAAVQQMQIAIIQTTPSEITSVNQTAFQPKVNLEKIQALVDQILVSVPDAKGRQEVRIQLSPEVMPGTEIRFERHEGQLHITFVSSDSSSLAFLGKHRQSLVDQLHNRLGQDVNLEIRSKEEQDGRSRHQRNLYEEMEES